MLTAKIFEGIEQPHVLCLGAHCDDIEIGCGGSILKLLEDYPGLKVTWVVFVSNEQRRMEAEEGAVEFAGNAGELNVHIFDFKDGFLPAHVERVKETFERLKREIANPDLILTHYRHDLHQDHRQVCELTWNTFRNHQILEYEIPKWDGDLGVPGAFIPLTKAQGERKIRLLQKIYNSQQTKSWFTDDLFWSLMRIRGMECHSSSTIAEAFHLRKVMLG
ncbi:PIG-L deacetylase family protein [Saccharospirillum salsuginis]|uniref:GlcNAc-PI de-N-acetylase n=1 Tax=Saccharospirillum salsuginis TaxID=418750 RepID=A0A918K538_9GAMM|nr:PIG-L deacetylase family protein [Saccharospirillum salsuginis]GGX49670.1 GlcNAc-PI de-N-acetylase [Saccharospirillum salsuginis]